jgi:hypothetical protein
MHEDPPFTPFEQPPGPPGDWTRLANEALGGNFEAFREHFAEDEARQCVEWCPVCRLADVLRANATPEMREQWSVVQRELMLALRSLADHYLERAERRGPERGPTVEDIPIE